MNYFVELKYILHYSILPQVSWVLMQVTLNICVFVYEYKL